MVVVVVMVFLGCDNYGCFCGGLHGCIGGCLCLCIYVVATIALVLELGEMDLELMLFRLFALQY